MIQHLAVSHWRFIFSVRSWLLRVFSGGRGFSQRLRGPSQFTQRDGGGVFAHGSTSRRSSRTRPTSPTCDQLIGTSPPGAGRSNRYWRIRSSSARHSECRVVYASSADLSGCGLLGTPSADAQRLRSWSSSASCAETDSSVGLVFMLVSLGRGAASRRQCPPPVTGAGVAGAMGGRYDSRTAQYAPWSPIALTRRA